MSTRARRGKLVQSRERDHPGTSHCAPRVSIPLLVPAWVGVSEHSPERHEDPSRDETPSFRAFLRYFLGLGTWGFGGPIATVGYMQRDLVEKRKWLSERDFLNGVALGQTMPGPLAAHVVMWVGFIQNASAAALATAALF